jgi:chromosome segregation ATPase
MKSAVQARESVQLLEEEVGTLKAELAQKNDESLKVAKLKEEITALQAHAQTLTALTKTSTVKGIESKRLQAQFQSSQEEINRLRVQLADARADIAKLSKGPERERVGLQEYIVGLESKIVDMENQLAEAESRSAEFTAMKNEGLALQEEVAALRVQLASSGDSSTASPGVIAENRNLQRQVKNTLWKIHIVAFI